MHPLPFFGGKMEKVMIFIDGSNFFYGMRANLGEEINIDFKKFINNLISVEKNRELVRTYYYNVSVNIMDDEEKFKDQQKFFKQLGTIPNFEIKLGKLVKRGSRRIEKGVDVLLATDMLFFAIQKLYDTAILVSGDADFSYVVERIKNYVKHVEYAYFLRGRSLEIQKVCDKYIELNNSFLESCLFKKKSK